MIDNNRKADANPTKEFFVSMITRDISLEDSIFDLIDNSVDSAWRTEGNRPVGLNNDVDLSEYSIRIVASREQFSIVDNCGGMTLDDAVDHAFSFGRRSTKETINGIGVYGIGMKRAAFKLGKKIRVKSTYLEADGSRQTFAVPVDVDDWLKKDDLPWDFDIVEEEDLCENGVKIAVTKLTQGAMMSFENPAFIQDLKRKIARDYTLRLNCGLNIMINNEAVRGVPITLRQSIDYVPIRVDYKDHTGSEEVTVEIIGGMAAPPPESVDPDEVFDGDKRFGWYVACNGRIVLAADKTSVSGWGTQDWPQWHRQYSGFIGIVLFAAANAEALPLTTTKRSVDVSSEIFVRARPRMREVSKQWIAYTNVRKQAREKAKEKEDAADAVSIHEVRKHKTVTLPKLVRVPAPRPANVNYSVPLDRMTKLKTGFGDINMSYRDVGLKSFNYAYEDWVGEG